MVEGGASVIAAFLNNQVTIVDLVIITVAPVWVGPDGVAIGNPNVSTGACKGSVPIN